MFQNHITTQIAKQRLELYTSLKLEVENRLEKLERLKIEEQLPAYKESDGSQHTAGNGDRMERAIIRRMEYEERIMPRIEKSREKMSEIESEVDELDDPMERETLRLRYMDGTFGRPMPWRDVALQLFGGDDEKHLKATYRAHGKALINFAKLLDRKG